MTNDFDWSDYYKIHAAVPHTRTLEKAVTNFPTAKDFALDIGAGNLRDTKYLLQLGFAVTAVDPSPASAQLAQELRNESLTMITEVIGKWNFPKNHFSLVNAQGILFHLPIERLKIVIEKIAASIKAGGVLCTNFLGHNDDWNKEGSDKTFLTQAELKVLLKDFDIVSLEEYERDGTSAASQIAGTNLPKHWHKLNVIAVKR